MVESSTRNIIYAKKRNLHIYRIKDKVQPSQMTFWLQNSLFGHNKFPSLKSTLLTNILIFVILCYSLFSFEFHTVDLKAQHNMSIANHIGPKFDLTTSWQLISCKCWGSLSLLLSPWFSQTYKELDCIFRCCPNILRHWILISFSLVGVTLLEVTFISLV